MVNKNLRNLSRCLVGKKYTDILLLFAAEFAYKCSINRTIRMSLFEVVYGFRSKQSVDLIPMTHHHTRVSASAASFVSHIHELHKEISTQIQKIMQTIKLM